jgi:hypothetical protein
MNMRIGLRSLRSWHCAGREQAGSFLLCLFLWLMPIAGQAEATRDHEPGSALRSSIAVNAHRSVGVHMWFTWPNQLPKVIQGVKFADGIEVVRPPAQTAAA